MFFSLIWKAEEKTGSEPQCGSFSSLSLSLPHVLFNISHPTLHSSNGCYNHDWVRPKPGTRNYHWVSPLVQGPRQWGHIPVLLFRHLSRELNRKCSKWVNSEPIRMPAFEAVAWPLTTVLTLNRSFNNWIHQNNTPSILSFFTLILIW